jgi:O-antigen ligase
MYSTHYQLRSERLTGQPVLGLPSIVGFYFGFRLFIMVVSVSLLGTDPQIGVGVDLVFNFLLLIVVAFFTIGFTRYPLKQMVQLPTVRWALFFLAFSGCSLFWTAAASLAAAIAFWCAMAADVIIVILLLHAEPILSVTNSLMKGYVWGACAVAIIAWLLPAQPDLRLGYADLLGPNQIGYLCAFAFFFAQWIVMTEKKEPWLLAALLLGITLLRSLSKTSIIAFLVAECFLLTRDRSITHRTKVWIAAAAIVIVALFWGLLESYYDVYTSSGSQIETLTGRLGIWAFILTEALQRPWIGHGFHSVWKVIPPFGADQFEARHAHNELLQQFYAYGVVGVCMFAGIYTSLFRNIRRLAKSSAKTFLLAFLLFVLVRGLTDTEPFDLSLPLWTIITISVLIEHAGTVSRRA